MGWGMEDETKAGRKRPLILAGLAGVVALVLGSIVVLSPSGASDLATVRPLEPTVRLQQPSADETLVGRLALVTVVFLLFIYALVIVACLKLRGQDEHEGVFHANTPLLLLGIVGNLSILGFAIYDDPFSLLWCAGLVAVGVVLFLIEYATGRKQGA